MAAHQPRRAEGLPDDSGDRNGEPSEQDQEWDLPWTVAALTIGALAVLVLVLIAIVAGQSQGCPY